MEQWDYTAGGEGQEKHLLQRSWRPRPIIVRWCCSLEKHWQNDHVAFAGEADVGLVILAWSCDVRIECQVIWMTGVAIAPDQANDDDLPFKSFMSLDVDSPV